MVSTPAAIEFFKLGYYLCNIGLYYSVNSPTYIFLSNLVNRPSAFLKL